MPAGRTSLQSPGGNFPLVYPVVFFTAWCTMMGALVYGTDTDGFTRLDRLFGLHRLAGRIDFAEPTVPAGDGGVGLAVQSKQRRSARAEILRAGAWILGFNASFWLVFVFPLILIRVFTGEPSALIP